MKQTATVFAAALFMIMFAAINAGAATPKTPSPNKPDPAKAKKAGVPEKSDAKEVILTGLYNEKSKANAIGTLVTYYVIIDSNKKEIRLPYNPDLLSEAYVGFQVRVVCLQVGPSLTAVKSIEPVDKAAFAAKRAAAAKAAKEAAAKEAAAREAAAKKAAATE